MAMALDIRDLHLNIESYEGNAHILRGINLSLNAGERVALVGESGCGKSSTAQIVLGLLHGRHIHINGEVFIDGAQVLGLSSRAWRNIRGRTIGMVFQDPVAALNPVFTVGDQLRTALLRGGRAKTAAEAYAVLVDRLRRVHIADPERVLASYPFQLSGGLCQRVLITMALVNRPKVVVADEPGSALDVTVQRQILRLMQDLTEEANTAVLLITHNLGVVREFAQRVYVMYAGTIVEEADRDTLFQSPKHPYTRALMASVPRLHGDRMPEPIEGRVPSYITPPQGCRFEPRCAFSRPACAQPPRLVETGGGHRVACVLYE